MSSKKIVLTGMRNCAALGVLLGVFPGFFLGIVPFAKVYLFSIAESNFFSALFGLIKTVLLGHLFLA